MIAGSGSPTTIDQCYERPLWPRMSRSASSLKGYSVAYNLMAEARESINWAAMLEQLRGCGDVVEYFPIPATSPTEADAIGISIPAQQAPTNAWRELECALKLLLQCGMEVTDLYAASRVTVESLDKVRG